MKMGRQLSKRVEITAGKGEIACYEQFLLSPKCFRKICDAEKGLIYRQDKLTKWRV